MADTAIEWTDKVWNPTTGCDRVSPGCDHCYALTMAKRLKGMGSAKYQNDGDPRTSGPGFGITEHPDTLATPFSWRTPKKVFVNSMSDLFHAGVSDEHIASVFAVMAATPRHTYQILTKRHARMRSLLSSDEFRMLAKDKHFEMLHAGLLRSQGGPIVINAFPSKNVWLGVSVESQQWADIRIPALLDTPAAVRWLSCEPLLGPVDLTRVKTGNGDGRWTVLTDLGVPGTTSIDWVVAGGESGHGARPMHPEWARTLRDQCTAAGVPFLFKQWGEWGPAPWKVPVCDPAVGWTGTDDELAAAKADAEARGATHAYASWAHEYGHELYQPPHKPWSTERDDHLDGGHAPMRRWGKKLAGRELDGQTWDQYPKSLAVQSRQDGAP